jgi:hypothetical protein
VRNDDASIWNLFGTYFNLFGKAVSDMADMKMAEHNKPPLGASPHWFVYRQRIKELSDAIGRHIEYIEQRQHTANRSAYYRAIAQWAKEIEILALLEAEIEKKGE